MTDALDMDLMREYARNHSGAAFTELVRRHLNLVYSVARRCTGNDGDAQDVTQTVFVILARKAPGLRTCAVLTGRLYETTRNTAACVQRTSARRHVREQEAYMQSTLTDANTIADWHRLAPLRDKVQALQQQQAPLAEQIRQLQRERDEATNRTADLKGKLASANRNDLELMKLRANATRFQAAITVENDPAFQKASDWMAKVAKLREQFELHPEQHHIGTKGGVEQIHQFSDTASMSVLPAFS